MEQLQETSRTQLSQAARQKAELESKVMALESELKSAQQTATDVSNQLRELQANGEQSTKQLQAEVTSLKEQVAKLEMQVNDLSKENAALKTAKAQLEQDKAALEEKLLRDSTVCLNITRYISCLTSYLPGFL